MVLLLMLMQCSRGHLAEFPIRPEHEGKVGANTQPEAIRRAQPEEGAVRSVRDGQHKRERRHDVQDQQPLPPPLPNMRSIAS